jgi:hypothetical protein
MSTITNHTQEGDATLFTRIISNGKTPLPADVARYFLDLHFSERDKARMHDLVVRNQEGDLSEAEKEELLSFGRVGDMLAILKSRARKTLGVKLTDRSTS